MRSDGEAELWRAKDGRAWRIGAEVEIAWIKQGTSPGLAITSAIPAVFEAYLTLELPDTPDGAGGWSMSHHDLDKLRRQDVSVLAVLSEHTTPQPWWLGYLDTGAADVIFDDAQKVMLYSNWEYVLIEAGAEQAGRWRADDHWKGVLPDLLFPADHSWLVSSLWDDDWRCIGGSEQLVETFLAHPDLRGHARKVEPSVIDATPPGHTAA